MPKACKFPFAIGCDEDTVKRYCKVSLFKSIVNEGEGFDKRVEEEFKLELRSNELLESVLLYEERYITFDLLTHIRKHILVLNQRFYNCQNSRMPNSQKISRLFLGELY